jgi:hypothetical protein
MTLYILDIQRNTPPAKAVNTTPILSHYQQQLLGIRAVHWHCEESVSQGCFVLL